MKLIQVSKQMTEDDIFKVQSAQFLVDGMKNILHTIITDKNIEISEEKFNQYIDRYIDLYSYFEMIKNKISHLYFPENGKVQNWTIDYNDQMIYFDVILED